jgi:hypothetical protein
MVWDSGRLRVGVGSPPEDPAECQGTVTPGRRASGCYWGTPVPDSEDPTEAQTRRAAQAPGGLAKLGPVRVSLSGPAAALSAPAVSESGAGGAEPEREREREPASESSTERERKRERERYYVRSGRAGS